MDNSLILLKITLLFKNGYLNSMWDCSVIMANGMQSKHALYREFRLE